MTLVACLTLAVGLALVWARADSRRFSLERRIAPRLRPVAVRAATPVTVAGRLAAPLLADLVRIAQRWGRPTAEVEARLARAGSTATVARHRLHGVVGGAAGLALGTVLGLAVASWRGTGPVPVLLVALAASAAGAIAPDIALGRRVAARAERMRAELPAVAEMLALAVVAGEAVAAALERVAALSSGPLGEELRIALAEVRAGHGVPVALDDLAARVGEPLVTSFCATVVTAIERGTPLADVLHAQAGDVRDRTRQALIEDGGRREIAMLVPVVLLILPITVVFALFPGLVALRLGG